MKLLSTITLIHLILIVYADQCPASHFDFIGRYSLGKQDELNRTFTYIQEKINLLSNCSTNSSDSATYTIFNAHPTFYYRDSKQQADILGDDIIVVFGGRLQVGLTFQWSRKGVSNLNGTGAAIGLSDMITFAKRAIIENGSYFSYELMSSQNISWNGIDAFSLIRIDPPTATDADKLMLTRMLNDIPQVKTIKNLLAQEIDKIYTYYLRVSLHDEHMPIDNHFDYIWKNGNQKSEITIPFSRRPISIDLKKQGASLTFDIQAANDTNWKCSSKVVPQDPLNPKIYGAAQQFISLDFYRNTLQYAINKGILDTNLTENTWRSRMFQFYAGDLYQVLDKIQGRYFAAEVVEGICKAGLNKLQVQGANTNDSLKISISFNCELNIKRNKIIDFLVQLSLEVQLLPIQANLDFKLRSHNQTIKFYPYADYRMLQEDLATAMVRHSINRLYDSKLFGSGWPMSPPRDYPQVMVYQNLYTVVFDKTQVPPQNDLQA